MENYQRRDLQMHRSLKMIQRCLSHNIAWGGGGGLICLWWDPEINIFVTFGDRQKYVDLPAASGL